MDLATGYYTAAYICFKFYITAPNFIELALERNHFSASLLQNKNKKLSKRTEKMDLYSCVEIQTYLLKMVKS